MDIEQLLAQRYGQSRFNPAAGQAQMSLQEWIDRHPALQGMGQDKLEQRYNASMQQPYTGAQNPVRPEFGMQAALNPGTQVGPAAGPMGGNATSQIREAASRFDPDSPYQQQKHLLRDMAGSNKRNKGAAQRRGAKKPAQPDGKKNNKQTQH